MNIKLAGLVRSIIVSSLLFPVFIVTANDTQFFYRGDLDDNKVEAANGAIVNRDYRQALLDGPYGKVRTDEVREGVYTISGYANANFTFIKTNKGLIAVDAGSNIGQAKEALRIIREKTDWPIVAIIYTHHHYTGGAGEYIKKGGNGDVTVYGHPDIDRNLQTTAGYLGPKQQRRVGRILGFYLPREGPDAVLATPDPHFSDPELNANKHVPVNYSVKDGEVVNIDGLEAIFYYSVGDTPDSLIVHFPGLELVVHNTGVLPTFAPLYTLRGEFYRNPMDMVVSIDKLRYLKPKYMIPSHGLPISNVQEAYDVATAHRDAYAFIYNQSIRAINKGLTPDEMVKSIRLPVHLTEHQTLAPTYIDYEYSIRGQYSGIVGWFAEDAADLHPPTQKELGEVMIDGFGSVTKLISSAQKAFDQKKYNLTAKLLSYVLAVKPENKPARQLKADALRAMAQATRTGMQTRNYMLTQALHLERKIDWTKPPEISLFSLPTVNNILSTTPGTYLKLLEVQIDPAKSANLEKSVGVIFSDSKQSWGIDIRRGVAEVTKHAPEKADAIVTMSRRVWARIVSKEITFNEAFSSEQATIEGSREDFDSVFKAFD